MRVERLVTKLKDPQRHAGVTAVLPQGEPDEKPIGDPMVKVRTGRIWLQRLALLGEHLCCMSRWRLGLSQGAGYLLRC